MYRRPNRSTSTVPTSTSPERSPIPKPVNGLTRPSLSADDRRRCYAWSPSTSTCGPSRATKSTMSSAAAPCWTAARRDRSRPCLGHPLDPPACLLRPAHRHPGSDGKAIDAGFPHIVLGLPALYFAHVARWSPTSSSSHRADPPGVEQLSHRICLDQNGGTRRYKDPAQTSGGAATKSAGKESAAGPASQTFPPVAPGLANLAD